MIVQINIRYESVFKNSLLQHKLRQKFIRQIVKVSWPVDFNNEAVGWEVDVERIEAAELLLYDIWELLSYDVYCPLGIVHMVTLGQVFKFLLSYNFH